ncbi:MAG TPA: HAMP domain-containing sensor histidine kinase [Candidatus Elarobacter sp.]|jgi:signal transduction histidine kinase|nr:HAMP domain-containing sensor histidine kinase [Candidatus Elarobacter sp.]
MKRNALFAAAAIAVLVCAAAGVWLAFVRSVADTMTAQARVADELLAADVPIDETFARTVLRPGIHVLAGDRRTGVVVDGGAAGVHTMPVPEGMPGMGPPRPGPDGAIALSLARLPPIRLDRGDRSVEIAPDVRVLSVWLTADVLLLLLGIVAVLGVTASRSAAQARARRRALETRAAERAAAAERYQRFLAEAGHELRTPLTVMSGYVDILRSRHDAEPLDDRIVEGMHAETARMRMLVEKMMTLARLESHGGVPRMVDVAAAARDAARTLQRRYPGRNVDVRTEQTASIIIDADDYAAALGNILENAVKYAPTSAVLIETAVRDGCASTAVIDRGPGIPASAREAIFEQFYRAHEGGEGLGLGLAIVKRVADRWNGTVDCESGNGRTVFRLSFPLADEEQHAAR